MKSKLNDLLEPYPSIMAMLPVFFEEIEAEAHAQAQMTRQAATAAEASGKHAQSKVTDKSGKGGKTTKADDAQAM